MGAATNANAASRSVAAPGSCARASARRARAGAPRGQPRRRLPRWRGAGTRPRSPVSRRPGPCRRRADKATTSSRPIGSAPQEVRCNLLRRSRFAREDLGRSPVAAARDVGGMSSSIAWRTRGWHEATGGPSSRSPSISGHPSRSARRRSRFRRQGDAIDRACGTPDRESPVRRRWRRATRGRAAASSRPPRCVVPCRRSASRRRRSAARRPRRARRPAPRRGTAPLRSPSGTPRRSEDRQPARGVRRPAERAPAVLRRKVAAKTPPVRR